MLTPSLSYTTGSPFSDGRSFFGQRSQSTDAVRRLAGVHDHQHHPDSGSTFTVTPIFSRSTHRRHLGQALFDVAAFNVTGSYVETRSNENDAFADYFGLSPEFQSFVSFGPKIHSYLLEADLFWNLSKWCPGWYIEFTLPVGTTRWDVDLEEDIYFESKNSPFPAGYQSVSTTPLPVAYTSFTQAIQGHRSFGAVKDGLLHSTLNGPHSKGGFADLNIIIGWDFCLQKKCHASVNMHIVAPTGSRPEGTVLFEPIFGNGKHWEVGLGFTGHIIVWETANGQELGMYTDITVSHFFKNKQRRTFDLKPYRFGSRYILAKEFDEAGSFTGTVTPVANFTTLDCHVHNTLSLDAAFMFGYTYDRFVFDVGYDGWIKTKDHISLAECIPSNKYGLKGIQNVAIPGTVTLVDTTESTATFTEYAIDKTNPDITKALHADAHPIFVSTDDIDTGSAAMPLAVTHKLFFYIGYSDHHACNKRITPFFGICTELEFEGMNRHATAYHEPSTLTQLTVWLRGGIEF